MLVVTGQDIAGTDIDENVRQGVGDRDGRWPGRRFRALGRGDDTGHHHSGRRRLGRVTGLPVTGSLMRGLPVAFLLVAVLPVRALLGTNLRRDAFLTGRAPGAVVPPAAVLPAGAAAGVPAVPALADRPPVLTATNRTPTARAAVTGSPTHLSRCARLRGGRRCAWRRGAGGAARTCWPRLGEGGRRSVPIARP